MAVSQRGIEQMKSELDKHEKKLLKHENKWNVASVVQRLSSHDQSRLLKASVAARTLTVTMIPKLKYKIDTWLTKREDHLLREVFADYEVIDNKVRWAFDEFKKLESGKEKASKIYKNERDKALSHSIEQSLRQKRDSKGVTSKLGISSSRSARISANIGQTSRSGETGEGVAGRSRAKPMSASSSKDKRVKEQLIGGGDVNETVLDKTKGLLNEDDETKKFLNQLQGALSPEELAWVMQSKEALTVTRDLEGKLHHKDRKMLKKLIEEKVMKGTEDQHQRASGSVKAGTNEESFGLKAKVPQPVPIDTFLNFVESLPGEIRHMVKEQTDTLCALQEEQIFSKNQLSDRKGRMVSMDKLREEYRDDRFDASDYKIRVPDALIEEEHLKWIKEQKVDDAVERYFGSFKKREPSKLEGDLLNAVLEPNCMERLPISDLTSEPQEDPDELLEKYHFQRVSLLQNQDFKTN